MNLTQAEQVAAGVGAAAGALVVLLVAVVLAWRSRRSTARRLAALVQRLERPGAEPEAKAGLERTLTHLERAADEAVLRVTEAEAAMQRVAAALEHVEEAVFVADEHGNVVFRNPRAAAEEDPLVHQTVNVLLASGVVGEPGTETLDVFGPPRRTVVVAGAALDDGWRSIGAVAVVRDVSEARRVEAAHRDFVANVGAEVRTPLGALGLLAETLAAEGDAAVARRLAQRIHGEAVRVGRMVEELSRLSRIEAEGSPTREPVPVSLVVDQAVERAGPYAEHRRVRVEVAPVSPELCVVGDRRQLVAAVHALVDNAVAYSDDGSAARVVVGTDGVWVAIAVRDEGMGIAEGERDRVFERFYRGDAARSRETGSAGAGLGLSIVRNVASNHGGAVEVESAEGQGSTFTLRLPVGPQAIRYTSAPAKAG